MGIGFCCVAGAATLLGILPTIQKQLMMNGLPLSGLMFYTNLTITVFCLVMALEEEQFESDWCAGGAGTFDGRVRHAADGGALKYQLHVLAGWHNDYVKFPVSDHCVRDHGNRV